MSVVDTFKEATQNLKQGNIANAQKSLRQIAQISKQQMVANESGLKRQMKEFTNALFDNVKQNEKQIGRDTRIPGLISKIAQNLPKQTLRQVGGSLSRVNRQVVQSVQNNVQQQVKQNVQAELQANIFQAAVKGGAQQLQMVPVFKQQSVARQNIQPIEKSVRQYSSLLSSANQMAVIRQSDVPKSILFLQKYAQLQNKVPIGKITGSQGVAFIGVQKIKTPDGRQLLFKYQQNQIRQTPTPNIPMQLRYHANRTINTWNNFIEEEAKLVTFLNKVSSQKRREQYTQQMFKKLNLQTFAAQTLATLTFYYVYLPLQKYIKSKVSSLQFSYKDFVSTYSVGIKSNPLFLTTDNAKKTVQILFMDKQQPTYKTFSDKNQPATPTNILITIQQWMKQITQKIGLSERKKLLLYFEQKQAQSRQFFTQSGVTPQVQSNLLANQDWSSIKRRAFYFPGQAQNNQYMAMCNQIIQKSKDQSKTIPWDLNWNSNSIPAYDYIFDDKYART